MLLNQAKRPRSFCWTSGTQVKLLSYNEVIDLVNSNYAMNNKEGKKIE